MRSNKKIIKITVWWRIRMDIRIRMDEVTVEVEWFNYLGSQFTSGERSFSEILQKWIKQNRFVRYYKLIIGREICPLQNQWVHKMGKASWKSSCAKLHCFRGSELLQLWSGYRERWKLLVFEMGLYRTDRRKKRCCPAVVGNIEAF